MLSELLTNDILEYSFVLFVSKQSLECIPKYGKGSLFHFFGRQSREDFPPNFLTQFPIFQPSNAIQTQYEIPSDVVLNFQIFLEYQGCPMDVKGR